MMMIELLISLPKKNFHKPVDVEDLVSVFRYILAVVGALLCLESHLLLLEIV